MKARPAVMGHRGAPHRARENTLESFRAAATLGCDWVELDARRTADGVVVVNHDPVFVPRSTLPEWVPTLPAALDACEGMAVNIEIKNMPEDPDFDPDEWVADAVAKLVPSFAGEVLVSSFHRPTIDRMRSLDPAGDVPTAWLTLGGWESPGAAVAVCVDGGHAAIHPWHGSVTAELVALAHDAGLRVNTWTVDAPDRMLLLADWGIDGICTNVPDVALEVLGRAG
jgi:glycerophosphoryl diester phosphodiesterase